MKGRDASLDAITEKEIFEEAKERMLIAEEAESDNRKLAKEDLIFCEGDQWDDAVTSSVSEQEIELTINLTDALVTRVVNNMKQQRPRGKCHPVGDGAQLEIAKVINGIGRHVETRSEASVAYDTGGELAVKIGVGYWRIVAEFIAANSFTRDLRILPIRNSFSVWLDPAAIMPTASDMNWGFIIAKMRRTEYKRLYPNAENTGWTDSESRYAGDWEDKESIRLAEYFRIREKGEKLFLLTDGQGREFTKYASEMPNEASLAAAGFQIVDDRMSARRTVEWFRLNGTKVVEREVLPGTYVPIIRCEGNAVDVDGKIVRRGMVRHMQDAQRMVNFGEVAKIKRLGLTPKAPWIAAEGQLDGHPEWGESNVSTVPVLTYKPVTVMTAQGEVVLPPPQRQPPAQLEAGFAEFTEGMRSNLLAIAGMPNEPGQDAKGQVVSGIALGKRQGISDQSHYHYYDNQTLAIAQTWRIMLEYIPVYFSEERMQRIIGEDSTPEMVKINEKSKDPGVVAVKNDLTVGRYDVVMDTGPGYETRREEGADALLELLKSPVLAELISKVGADLVFRSIDHPYMQELADRIVATTPEGLQKVMAEMPERARSVIQALAAHNKQLEQALQQAQVEIKYGITKAHIAATVKAHDVEETNQTRRADTAIKAHTALAVEEIKAGASLMNTHVEAKHHEREAERMIEQSESAERANGAPNGNAGT